MLIKTRSGYWYEVECKISFADFKNDFTHKWQKHELLKTGEWHPLTFVRRETDEKALSKYESYPGYHIEKTGKAWNIYIKGQEVAKESIAARTTSTIAYLGTLVEKYFPSFPIMRGY